MKNMAENFESMRENLSTYNTKNIIHSHITDFSAYY